MNVVVAIPCLDFCPTPFVMCLATMMATPQKDALGRPIRVGLAHCQGSILQEARNQLAAQARAMAGATHMLWLDSDMAFPPLTIQRLARHGVEIVTASYVKRYEPHDLLGEPSNPPLAPPRKGLAEMDLMPLGVSLIKLSVYDSIPMPWFDYHTGEDGRTVSEDYLFCAKARKAGFTVWMDVELTRELGHVGIKTYRTKGTVP